MFRFLRKGRGRIKTCGLSYETPLLFSSSPPLFWKRRPSLAHGVTHGFLIRTAVRANGHAPAHRAHSEFEILAFPFTRNSLIQCALCVKERPFFAFTSEGKRGEDFTRKSLFPSLLPSYGEEVKAKNEKQRTRALRVRVGGLKWEAGALSRKGFR